MYDKSLIKPIVIARLRSKSLKDICADEDMPDRDTIMLWQAQDPEFSAQCAHARAIQVDAMVDDMADIEDRVLTGEIDPAAARVVLDSQRWRAMKIAPKTYGDKTELTVKRGHDDITDAELQAIARRNQDVLELEVSENTGQYTQ
jgi:hypothetical protein